MVRFKFHYVSINSDNVEFTSHATDSPLNSIMFLLILRFIKECKNSFFDFKFHYVSINSNTNGKTLKHGNNFKFHYVSINSAKRNRTMTTDNAL